MNQDINITGGVANMKTFWGFSLTDVSTSRQRRNGTIILSLKCNNQEYLFGSYKSGYVRKLPSRSAKMFSCYQINPVVTLVKNYYHNGKTYPGETTKRVLIPCGLDRLEYLGEFIDRNFAFYQSRDTGSIEIFPRRTASEEYRLL
jgi:hypothetical protein